MIEKVIPPQTGDGFLLRKGSTLTVKTLEDQQVADLFCFPCAYPDDPLSSGRSIDYNETVYLTKGHFLYSFQGRPLLKIVEDTCGRHDFLVTPCSLQMFQMLSGTNDYHPSCQENLCRAFLPFEVDQAALSTTFNIFMNYEVSVDGKISLKAPKNKKGDYITFEALEDLFVGLTACSDPATNAGSCKAVAYTIHTPEN